MSDAPLRICTPHCGLDPETRLGGEMYEVELLRELGQRGAMLDIILARGKPYPAGVPNWVVHRLPMRRGLRWPVAAAVLPPFIARVWRATRFDLLRVHSLRYIGPAALIARRRYRLDVPVVAHHHHLDPSWLNPVIERRVMRAAERVVVGSEFARRQAIAELGVPAEKLAVVPYGVDRGFRPAPKPEALVRRHALDDKLVVLFLGHLEPRKNLDVVLDVWAEVARARADATLVIAGAGPLAEELRRRAASLVVAGRVVFTGHVPAAEKVDHFNLADVLLFPSRMEGFGLVVAEAMSCGVPVIVSDRGSLPELLDDGDGGFVCDPDDRATLVRRTLELLGDAALRRRFGDANRARVERRFRWDLCAEATERVYEEVLEAWRRRPALIRP